MNKDTATSGMTLLIPHCKLVKDFFKPYMRKIKTNDLRQSSVSYGISDISLLQQFEHKISLCNLYN